MKLPTIFTTKDNSNPTQSCQSPKDTDHREFITMSPLDTSFPDVRDPWWRHLKGERSNTSPQSWSALQSQEGDRFSLYSDTGDNEASEGARLLNDKPNHLKIFGYNFKKSITILWCLNFICSLDNTIIYTTMSSIASDFNQSQLVTNIVLAYLLASTSFQPFYGRTSDILGRWRLLKASQVFYFVGTLISASAIDVGTLSFGRAITGIGSAGVYSLTAIIIGDDISFAERSVYFGYQNVVCSVASMIGGPLGGFMLKRLSWRWIFILQLPFIIITTITGLDLKDNNSEHIPEDHLIFSKENLKRINFGGILCLISFIVSVSYLLSSYSIDPSIRNALIIIAVVSCIGFVIIEHFVAVEKFINPALVKSEIGLLGFIYGINSLGLNLIFFVTPLYLQIVQEISVVKVGYFITAFVASIACGSVIIGTFMRRYKSSHHHVLNVSLICILACLGFMSIGLFILYLIIDTSMPLNSSWGWKTFYVIGSLIAGFGGGGFNVGALVYVTGSTGKEVQASANTVVSLIKCLSGIFGLSVSLVLYTNSLSKDLTSYFQTQKEDSSIVKELLESSLNVQFLPAKYLVNVCVIYGNSLLHSFYPSFGLLILGIGVMLIMIPRNWSTSIKLEETSGGNTPNLNDETELF